jgi:hypothetical protein
VVSEEGRRKKEEGRRKKEERKGLEGRGEDHESRVDNG